MKTKDFIQKVRELGYCVRQEYETEYRWIEITIGDEDLSNLENQVASISATWEAWGEFHGLIFSGHNEIELMRVISEYLDTPLEEREPKKYIYQLIHDVTAIPEEYHIARAPRNTVKLDTSGTEQAMKIKKFHFTDEEVEKYEGKDRLLFEVCEKFEVTK